MNSYVRLQLTGQFRAIVEDVAWSTLTFDSVDEACKDLERLKSDINWGFLAFSEESHLFNIQHTKELQC